MGTQTRRVLVHHWRVSARVDHFGGRRPSSYRCTQKETKACGDFASAEISPDKVKKTEMGAVPTVLWVSLGTIAVTALVAGLARAAEPQASKLNGKALVAVQQYVENAVKMSKQAEQDADLTQRLTDVCFGIAYVNAARAMASDAVLEQKCGVKIDEVHSTLRAMQQQTLLEMENK